MDINIRSMMAFDSFIKLKYQDSVLWNHGKPTHPLYIDLWDSWQQAQKVAVPEPTNEVICAIENTVQNQLIASGIASDPFRLDGEDVYKAMIKAVEKNDE